VSREQAAEIATELSIERRLRRLLAVNRDTPAPGRAFYLECNGLKAYPDPQPRGQPISLVECDRKLRERQARMGVPVNGMTDEQKATYSATWGNESSHSRLTQGKCLFSYPSGSDSNSRRDQRTKHVQL